MSAEAKATVSWARWGLAYVLACVAAMAVNAALTVMYAGPGAAGGMSLGAFVMFVLLLAPFGVFAALWEGAGRAPSVVLYMLTGALSAFAFVALRDVYLGVFDVMLVTRALGKLLKAALHDPLFNGSILVVAASGGFVFALLRRTVLAARR